MFFILLTLSLLFAFLLIPIFMFESVYPLLNLLFHPQHRLIHIHTLSPFEQRFFYCYYYIFISVLNERDIHISFMGNKNTRAMLMVTMRVAVVEVQVTMKMVMIMKVIQMTIGTIALQRLTLIQQITVMMTVTIMTMMILVMIMR